MRFLLINPFYPISETPSPPLGLAYLAASLERAGVEVKILDYVVYPYSREALAAALQKFSPHIAGLTAVTMTFNHAAQVVRDIKTINSDILTVMGGPHVSMCAKETLAALPELDMVVIGEADDTIVELAAQFSAQKSWAAVPGLVYRETPGHPTAFHATPVKAYAVDVRSLPFPARHLLSLGRYRALNMPISMTTSRGCPYKCIFCVGRKMVGAKVRYRDPRAVVDEMEMLQRLHFSQINIADDLFTASRKHCLGVCEEIFRRGLNIRWSSFARVDLVSDEILHQMKTAGCTTVSFGVETANPEILKTIKKGITLDQVMRAIRACLDAGIFPHVSFILGLPGETPETIEETRSLGETIKEMGGSYGFHLLAPFPGTEIREKAEELGIRILSQDWSEYHANQAIVETDGADRHLMNRIVREWQDRFDLWLGQVKINMDNDTAAPEEAEQLISLENTVILYDIMMKAVLEKHLRWDLEAAKTPASSLLSSLADRVCGYTGYGAPRVLQALERAQTAGCLGIRNGADQKKRWQWIDHPMEGMYDACIS